MPDFLEHHRMNHSNVSATIIPSSPSVQPHKLLTTKAVNWCKNKNYMVSTTKSKPKAKLQIKPLLPPCTHRTTVAHHGSQSSHVKHNHVKLAAPVCFSSSLRLFESKANLTEKWSSTKQVHKKTSMQSTNWIHSCKVEMVHSSNLLH